MGRKYRGANKVEDSTAGPEAEGKRQVLGTVTLYADGDYEWSDDDNDVAVYQIVGMLELIKSDVLDSAYFDCEETEDDYE